MDPVIIATFVSFFGYCLYGAAGFGAAMIFHSLWTILEMFGITSGRVDEATYYLNVMTLMVTIVMSINNRHLIQWKFVTICCIPWFAMNVIGCFLLVGVPNEILKFILGIVLVVIFIQQFYKTITNMLNGKMLQEKIDADKQGVPSGEEVIPEVDIREKWFWLAFAGCFGGILSGLFNMPGPATIIVLLFSGIHRERWKANFFCWQIPAQIFVVWFLSTKAGLYKPDMFPWYCIMCLNAVCASKLGNFLGKTISKTTFTFIVIGLSFMGACSDLGVMLDEEVKKKIMVFGLGCAFMIMGLLFYMLNKYVNVPFESQHLDPLAMDDAEAQYHRFDGSGGHAKRDPEKNYMV
jgi:uncharacterized membrane protein YfcA